VTTIGVTGVLDVLVAHIIHPVVDGYFVRAGISIPSLRFIVVNH
jgi:hypothetical protein